MDANTGMTKNITDLIDNYLASGYPPGAAVAAYHGEHEPFQLTIGRGLANKESALKAGPEVIFELGSVTKVFTATLLGLQPSILNDPLSKHLPVTVNNSNLTDVTLQQLATHTSGFPRDVPARTKGPGKDGAVYLFRDQAPLPNSALVKFWNSWAPTNRPNYCSPCKVGTCWQYSNVGFVTLGYAAAGEQYNAQLAANITGPQQLNMSSTAAQVPPTAKKAQGYHKNGTAATKEAEDLKSNANDMLIWIKAQLGVGSVPQALASAIALTQKTYFTSKQQCAQSKHLINFNMGLAWQIHPLPGTKIILFIKDGASGLGGQSCWVGFVPERKAGVAVLTNGVGAKPAPAALGLQILDTLLGLPLSLQHAVGHKGGA